MGTPNVLVSHEVLHGHLGEQAVRESHEHLGDLDAELRHHGLQHLVPVAPEEQVGRLGCNREQS